MAPRISPNRRRSIAVLGQPSSKAIQKRRRAYSIVPGEKLSPAARARNLAPRKSILKGVHARPSQDSIRTSFSTADEGPSSNVTMSMDMTEIIKPRPVTARKSLARRVSFASHAHVRLFKKERKSGSNSSKDEEEDEAADEFADDDMGEQRPKRRHSDTRRRSSLGIDEDGEESMELDEDDTAPIPQGYLNGPALGDEEPQFSDEEEFGEDVDMTETFPHPSLGRKFSLGFGRESLPGFPAKRRRSSVVTSSQNLSENQPYRPRLQPPPDQFDEDDTQQLYPSLENEDNTSRHAHFQDMEENFTIATQSDMDLTTTSSLDPTTSSAADTTAPMEFTIPVVRPPPPPDEQWLKLRAMTHAGAEEPYVPPEMEPLDDPEANAIVPSEPYWDEENSMPRHNVLYRENGEDEEDEREGGEVGSGSGMDLTDALSRLAKARPSLGLPPLQEDESQSFAFQDGDQNDTFSSTDSSFGAGGDMSLDGNQTLNLTKLRMSLGGQSVELTGSYGEEPEVTPHHPPEPATQTSKANIENRPPTSQASANTPPSVFSAPRSVFSAPKAPSPAQSVASPPVFSANSVQSDSSTNTSQKPSPTPTSTISQAKPPTNASIPKPFTFNAPARLANDASPAKRASATPKLPPSPSKLPVFKGTAAFAPPTATKSPRKRSASEDVVRDPELGAPSPAKKQAVGKLQVAGAKSAEQQPSTQTQAAVQNRRASAVRRPSGYFAQRKSLGGAASASMPAPSNDKAAPSLSKSVSFPSVSSQTSGSQSKTAERIKASQSAEPPERMYPDLSSIQEELTQTTTVSRPQSPATPQSGSSEKDKDKACERETRRQSNVVPTPTRGSPSPYIDRPASPVMQQQRRQSVIPTPVFAQERRQSHRPPPIPPASPVVRQVNAAKGKGPVKTLAFAEETTQMDGIDDMGDTQQWRDGVEDDLDDGEPTISIEQFFQMTNIRFMDEITAPRRSMIHPSHLRPHNRRRSLTSSHSEEAEQIPLAEFMTAMSIEVPQLELYSVLAEDLTGWIEESKKICAQAEEDAVRMTPALFAEFALADEPGKQDLLHQLKIIKANTIGGAKSQWYDWKSEWVGRLQESAEEAFTGLESDAQFLEKIINQAQSMLPSLRTEYAQVMDELEKEEAAIVELEKSDKEYLSELKVSIAEQDMEIQAFRANLSEAEAKLQRLQEKHIEIDDQKQEITAAIVQAERVLHIQTESTSSEVFRLKDELEALEDLHLWRTTKMSPNHMELVYANRYRVVIPCTNYRPFVPQITVTRTSQSESKERDPCPALTKLMVSTAPYLLSSLEGHPSLPTVIQRLGDFWSSCAEVRSQLTFLRVKYPLVVEAVPADNTVPSLQASATVLFPAAKSKASITFLFDWDTYSRWPLSIGSLKCDVKVAYGGIDRQKVVDAVLDRLSQATPSENHGCLLDACIEATEQFA